ncbi:Engulfment and cell motility protein 2 [Xenoophorus captivus]|uniref:Engulfment and cell motility protein 2 n=1 Tax=Xenoophorus captivus TaxID=1517983 RepID=A0ABV0QVR8_9TELE
MCKRTDDSLHADYQAMPILDQYLWASLVSSSTAAYGQPTCFYFGNVFVCSANEGCNDYYPMFFTHDRAWEEFFCVCIQLLNKTWKEMRATAEDFNKVMQVVREQITRALAMKPSSIDQLKNKLRGLNYSEILRLRQSERISQDDFQSPPIMSVLNFTA